MNIIEEIEIQKDKQTLFREKKIHHFCHEATTNILQYQRKSQKQNTPKYISNFQSNAYISQMMNIFIRNFLDSDARL